MSTPTPTSAMKQDVSDLLHALPGLQSGAARRAIVREVLALFDSATALPEPRKDAPAYVPTPQLPLPASDVNGSEPAAVEEAIERTFVQPAHAELLVMQAMIPNGIEVNQ